MRTKFIDNQLKDETRVGATQGERRKITNRNWGVSIKYQLFKVSQYLLGWINYFGIASGYQHYIELDHWIRRRVRMSRAKVRNVMLLGVHVHAVSPVKAQGVNLKL